MKIYLNEDGEIYDVGSNTTGEDLTEVEVTDGTFDGWSKGKMLCYKVQVVDGVVVMMTPCVDSRLIRNFDNTQPFKMSKTAYIDDTSVTFYEVPTGNVTVYIGGYSGNYTVNRVQDRLTVEFEPLEEVTEVTINVI